VLFGQVEPTKINVDELQARLDRADHRRVRESLNEVGFPSAVSLLATYAGQASRLETWGRHAELNTDRNLRLQYLAGLWLNSFMGKAILDGILAHYKFPEDVFQGSDESLDELRSALTQAGRPNR